MRLSNKIMLAKETNTFLRAFFKLFLSEVFVTRSIVYKFYSFCVTLPENLANGKRILTKIGTKWSFASGEKNSIAEKFDLRSTTSMNNI